MRTRARDREMPTRATVRMKVREWREEPKRRERITYAARVSKSIPVLGRTRGIEFRSHYMLRLWRRPSQCRIYPPGWTRGSKRRFRPYTRSPCPAGCPLARARRRRASAASALVGPPERCPDHPSSRPPRSREGPGSVYRRPPIIVVLGSLAATFEGLRVQDDGLKFSRSSGRTIDPTLPSDGPSRDCARPRARLAGAARQGPLRQHRNPNVEHRRRGRVGALDVVSLPR